VKRSWDWEAAVTVKVTLTLCGLLAIPVAAILIVAAYVPADRPAGLAETANVVPDVVSVPLPGLTVSQDALMLAVKLADPALRAAERFWESGFAEPVCQLKANGPPVTDRVGRACCVAV
jgi:hypothetical protein